MKRRTAYLALAIAAAAAAAVATQWPQTAETAAPAPVAAAQSVQPQQSALPGQLPERSTLRGPAQPLFGVQAPPAPKRAATPPPPQPVVVVVPQPPTPPYRYVGSVTVDNKLQHVLAEADRVFPVIKGDTIGGVYRVEGISREKVTLRYVPLDALVELPLIPQNDGRATALAGAPNIPSPQQGASASGESSPAFSGIRAAQLRGPRNPN